MFIGHFATGLAAKKLNSKPSLGTYFLAAQFIDLIWPTLLLLNIEKVEISTDASHPIPLVFSHYPVSHSLLAVLGWGVLFGLIYFFIKRNVSASIILAACVVSHWFIDLVVHVPDLPLYPGSSTLAGLGLWNYQGITLVVELLMFVAGVYLYLTSTSAKNKKGIYVFWSLIVFLVIVHLMNTFGTPPPTVEAVAWAGQLQWILVLWAYWADANRIAKDTQPVKKGSLAYA